MVTTVYPTFPAPHLMRLGPQLTNQQVRHLQRLVAWWTLLADLSFSDLLLFMKASADDNDRFVVVAQVRASTGRTLYHDDHVGDQVTPNERPFVAAAVTQGRIQTGEVRLMHNNARAHVTSIPVHSGGKVVAALSSEVSPEFINDPDAGHLERNYLTAFAALADMVASGDFPYPAPPIPLGEERHSFDPEHDELPRVGDGMLLVDDANVVTFASPNAVSAMHRVGMTDDIEGKRLEEIGLTEDELSLPRPRSAPVATEIDREHAVVQVTALPLKNVSQGFQISEPHHLSALMLLRDVTALRQRDQLLRSKDRTIAEIHHRVKNNLQTISSLLRIQARRLSSNEANLALQESIRRIGAIALVHEALSTEAADDVDFCGVAHVLADTMRHSFTPDERPIEFLVRCSLGPVPTDVVTPLAMVLTELLQNAVDHAYPEAWTSSEEGSSEGNSSEEAAGAAALGTVEVDITQPRPDYLRMTVRDDGVGLPEGFDITKTQGLGTSIVRALTTADLHGTITYSQRKPGPGSVVTVEVPLQPRPEGG